ncbi:aldehyde dehydrogenase [Rhizoclosmatium globosum]|uniref:Aldehyde dehydrogenase n=1 Tax=Rhizoclosmatium globosum TaxID=329046 RepID=A0A1Y2CTD5_9FUNG|nr:aldehyde dehydrogenase [Rhizoclosmatium globosum]|eukprot:ORY50283.1 aldehyde dehydrogenase [Rhizoclosmatium globosum]
MTAEGITLQHPNGTLLKNVPTGLFINNTFVPSQTGDELVSVDPNTGAELCRVSEAGAADVDAAVSAATAAFQSWSETSASTRGRLLYKLADLLERDRVFFELLESLDSGKLMQQVREDIDLTLSDLRFFAGCADKNDGAVKDIGPDSLVYTRHEAFGVVGLILPWNYPLQILGWKLSPAVVSGNTVVIKTSEKTPLSALKFCELVVEAGFPPGVVNVLSGSGRVGDALARHMAVQKVAFTGSSATGRKVMAAAAESNLKSVSLELGGKSPMIIFSDADLDLAVSSCVSGFTSNAGQVCCATTRIYVHSDIHDAFVAQLQQAVSSLKVGANHDPSTELGPLVDKIQFDRVLSYIQLGKESGAKVLTGGFHLQPTVFIGCTQDMRIVNEEIFGPVLCVLKFDTLDQVIQLANDSPYGLAAAVFTKDMSTSVKCVNALKAGTVWVNGFGNGASPVPFGGYKQSGFGKDSGKEALATYTQTKAVWMNL